MQDRISKSQLRKCIKCGTLLTSLTTTAYRARNHIHKCHECVRKEKREWARSARLRNPGSIADRSRRHRDKLKRENPKKYSARQMVSSARKRAIRLDLPFDLDVDCVMDIAPDKCPVFGWSLKYGGGDKAKNSPSLDRIDPKKGYVVGNVSVISLLANTMKNEATKDELHVFAKWILK